MPNLIVSAVSTFDNKGLKKGRKEVSAFEKQVKTFGKTFAAVFSARALFNYSKNAVKAFAEDEKAAKALEIQLKNTGFAFSAPSVEYFIANLQKTTGVLDDELRPAFQKLLTVTGSITKSQDALQTALNVSAAGYGSVVEVSQALSKGFGGQTTALGRLIPSLDKAVVKSGDMNKIMQELNKEFAGQSAARLTTYAGKMDLLKVASENVKEEIGEGIIGALEALSKDTSIADTATKMENFGRTTADVITGVGVLIAELQKLPGVKKLTDFLFDISVFGSLARLGQSADKPKSNFTYELGASATKDIERANAILAKRAKAAADALKLLNEQTKKKTEVDKLRDKFDVDRIGLYAALNAATDDETKLRLKSLIAINENNEVLAKKYNAELDGVISANKLATAANTAATFLDILASRPNPLFTSTGEMTARGRNQIAPDEFVRVPQGVTNQAPMAAAGAAASTPTQATLEVAPNASADRLVQAIAETVRVNLKYGNKLVPAGGID